jgi:hypothetical protein
MHTVFRMVSSAVFYLLIPLLRRHIRDTVLRIIVVSTCLCLGTSTLLRMLGEYQGNNSWMGWSAHLWIIGWLLLLLGLAASVRRRSVG